MSELITGYAIGLLVVAFVAWLKNRPVLELVGWSLLVSPLLILIWLIFSPTLEVFKFQGSKNLDNENYKIYLTKQYKISKIDTINKFECFGKTFETADDALEYAFKHDCGFAFDYIPEKSQDADTTFKSLSTDSVAKSKKIKPENKLSISVRLVIVIFFAALLAGGIKLFESMTTVQSEKSKENLNPPILKQGESYESVRLIMLKNGWSPFAFPPDRDFYCGDSDTRCQGKPETEACTGAGTSQCVYSWVKNGRKINICTWDEENTFNEYCK